MKETKEEAEALNAIYATQLARDIRCRQNGHVSVNSICISCLTNALALADTLVAAVPAAHRLARLEGDHATDDRDWETEDYGYENCQDELCVAARAYRDLRKA